MDDITHTILAVVMLFLAYGWGHAAGELSNRSRALVTLLSNLVLIDEEEEETDESKDK